jgi:proteasome lid subunit RPN8/RPN11
MDEIQDLPDEEESKLKKVFVFVIGVILILLMVSFIFVGYPLGSILEGQIESNPLKGEVIKLDDFSIIFAKSTLERLQEIYFSEQEVEFSVCLLGEKIDEDYFITSLYQPKMFDQTFNHVSFESCSSETKIILHSHPYKSCLASDTDINTLKNTRVKNKEALMVVMCEPKRFSVY